MTAATTPSPAPAPGRVPPATDGIADAVLASYELLEELGRGGMGIVYKAWHRGLRTHRALKVIAPGQEAGVEAVKRLLREARALAKLRHPGIVEVFDVIEAGGQTYLVMEYVEGTTLDKLVDASRREYPGSGGGVPRSTGLPPVEAARILRDVATALHRIHEVGVLHRDLKPGNIILDRDRRPKVLDFGLSRIADPGESRLTGTGTMLGTPEYTSPEEVEHGMAAVDEQSDVYQLGAILYELLTGAAPYSGDSGLDVLVKVSREDPAPPRARTPSLPRNLEAICLRAMSRGKLRRYPTAKALAEDCARFLRGEAVTAREERWWERMVRRARGPLLREEPPNGAAR